MASNFDAAPAQAQPVADGVQSDSPVYCMACDGHGAREDDPGEWSECPICKGTGIAVGQPSTTQPVADDAPEEQHEIAVLLRLRQPMADGNHVHVIITKHRYEELKTLEELNSHDKFLYNSHTCPTNWLGVEYIIDEEDCDPHGIFEHVQTIEIPRDGSGNLIDLSDCENNYGIEDLRTWFSALAAKPSK